MSSTHLASSGSVHTSKDFRPAFHPVLANGMVLRFDETGYSARYETDHHTLCPVTISKVQITPTSTSSHLTVGSKTRISELVTGTSKGLGVI